MHIPSWPRRDVRLRITSPEDDAPRGFEAFLVLGGLKTMRLAAQTPYETALPDRELTIVVSPTAPGAALTTELEVMRRGRQVLRGWSSHTVAVIHRRRGGIVAGGLDGPAGDHDTGTPAELRVV